MRAARTDKGVSAVGQLVSLKMLVGQPDYDIIEQINKHLPNQIRVLGYTKTTGGFDARKHCDKRRYEYVLPAWAFDPTACRGRLCVEEAELRSAANPAVADGVLPSDLSTSQPSSSQQTAVAQQASAASEALAEATAEATAAAVAAEPTADDGTTALSAEDSQLTDQGKAAGADLPDPNPAEILQTASASGVNFNTEATLKPTPADQSKHDALRNPGQSIPHSPAQGVSSSPAQGISNSSPPGHESAPQSELNQTTSSDFAFDDAAVRWLNTVLKQYEGTHNFHNFTVRLEASDPSAKRYMLSCKCPGTFSIKVTASAIKGGAFVDWNR